MEPVTSNEMSSRKDDVRRENLPVLEEQRKKRGKKDLFNMSQAQKVLSSRTCIYNSEARVFELRKKR